jgi:hypothetical protein
MILTFGPSFKLVSYPLIFPPRRGRGRLEKADEIPIILMKKSPKNGSILMGFFSRLHPTPFLGAEIGKKGMLGLKLV